MGVYIPPNARAQELLRNMKINSIPTPVEWICGKLNIECQITSEITVEALIVKGVSSKRTVIAVREGSEYYSRTRFSIAHELGHFSIPDHLEEAYNCTLADLNNYQGSKPGKKKAEIEANEFAAELLMPSNWVSQQIKSNDVSMHMIKQIANDCDTSLTSTALQVTKYCSDRIAVIYSCEGDVCWFKKAKGFDLYLEKGALSKSTLASSFIYSNPSLNQEVKDYVPLNAWCYDERNYNYLIEESLFMPKLRSSLTILTIPFDEYEEEADPEDPLFW